MIDYPDVGVVLTKLDNNPLCDAILKSLSQLVDKMPYSQVIVFTSSCKTADTHNIPVLHMSHAKFFSGILISTDVTGLIMTENYTNTKQRFFFAYETPWVGKNVGYNQWKNIFANDNLEIISENVQIDNIYNMCWKQTAGIAEGFNHERLLNIISRTKK